MKSAVSPCNWLASRLTGGGRATGARAVWIAACVALHFSFQEEAHAQRPLGCDISSYQANVNWTQVTNAGMVFAWVKATESNSYVNPYFTSQENGAKAAHVYIGAYHYARPSGHPNITGANSADTEAAYFWNTASNYVKFGGTYLVPMLDWEDPIVTNQLSAATMSAWVNEWCNSVSNLAAAAGVVGIRPVVYTGTWYSQPSSTYSGLTTAVTNWANWMSDYSGNPQTGAPTTYPWPSWKIWQYNDTNTSVANWTGGDVDVFNGTSLASFLQTFVVGGTNAPNFTVNPASVIVTPGSSASFSAQVTGQAPLTFRWYFNGTIISGAASSNYTIANVQLANVGSYTLTISNAYAKVSSSAAYLTVLSNAAASVAAPANLVNWWPAELTPVDIVGANSATPNNVTYTTGEVGSAFNFNGSTAYLSDSASELTGNWTLCLWVNRQNASTTSASLMGDGTYALKLEQYKTTREVGLTKSGVADYLFSPAITVPTGQWTHLAFAYNGSTLSLYTNGILASSQLTSNSIAVSPPPSLPLPRAAIGGDLISGSLTDPMLGSLDEIQVYGRALSGSEIASIYHAGGAGLVRVPQFNGVVTAGNGQVQLNLSGLTGKTFTLYSSTNLVTWTTLGTFANPTGTTNYTDTGASGPQKFYRVSQP